MFAIIKTGGKQYKVESGVVLQVERLDAPVGSKSQIDDVLLLSDSSGMLYLWGLLLLKVLPLWLR
jgi:large subunit ribosomal protein L21